MYRTTCALCMDPIALREIVTPFYFYFWSLQPFSSVSLVVVWLIHYKDYPKVYIDKKKALQKCTFEM